MHRFDYEKAQHRTLPAVLREQATHNGDGTFLIEDEIRLSFAEVYQKSLSLARAFSEMGVKAGDRIGLLLHNCHEMVLVALAANLIRAVWVPINTDYRGEWLNQSIKRSRCQLLVTEGSLGAHVDAALAPEIILTIKADDAEFTALLSQPAFHPEIERMPEGDTASIVWTSGTTGRSKGVMVSHNNWLRPICRGTSNFFLSRADDIIMNVLPMHHAGAWNTSVLRALVEGIPVILEKQFSVRHYWSRVNHYGATQSFTLGAMHIFLWNAPAQESDSQNTLRTLQAIPMPQDLVAPFEARFNLKLLGSGYGQSECMMVTTTVNAKKPVPNNSIGFPAQDIQFGLFDDADQEVEAGEVGEMRVKPLEPHIVCNGYFDDAKATAAAWQDGWFCTGDLGYTDSSGACFFSDRKKDAVRFAGRNISTLEVESVVRQHEAVADVAAYGITSKELSSEDELKIDILLKPDSKPSFEGLAAFINANAPYYFVPRYMDFVEQLPYTPTGKVQKYLLREQGVTPGTWDLKASSYQVSRG